MPSVACQVQALGHALPDKCHTCCRDVQLGLVDFCKTVDTLGKAGYFAVAHPGPLLQELLWR